MIPGIAEMAKSEPVRWISPWPRVRDRPGGMGTLDNLFTLQSNNSRDFNGISFDSWFLLIFFYFNTIHID